MYVYVLLIRTLYFSNPKYERTQKRNVLVHTGQDSHQLPHSQQQALSLGKPFLPLPICSQGKENKERPFYYYSGDFSEWAAQPWRAPSWSEQRSRPALASLNNSFLNHSHIDCFSLCKLNHLMMAKHTVKRALSAPYQGVGKDEVGHMWRTVPEQIVTLVMWFLAPSVLTWGLELSINEGEQLLADAAVGNRPGQEAVVGAGCLQKEVWIRWEVRCLGWKWDSTKWARRARVHLCSRTASDPFLEHPTKGTHSPRAGCPRTRSGKTEQQMDRMMPRVSL